MPPDDLKEQKARAQAFIHRANQREVPQMSDLSKPQERYGTPNPGCPSCGSGHDSSMTLPEIIELFEEGNVTGDLARHVECFEDAMGHMRAAQKGLRTKIEAKLAQIEVLCSEQDVSYSQESSMCGQVSAWGIGAYEFSAKVQRVLETADGTQEIFDLRETVGEQAQKLRAAESDLAELRGKLEATNRLEAALKATIARLRQESCCCADDY